ncbi:hypothetical protein T552_00075 [Pneumocystis carinii B80]|uniref:Glucosidase 2 subunit beta n=1 Tax=Pneumocystis carinii (strain B80) TaxID=1408658 RepID=A0A0W4ZST2_PNEC8|nr:hypothetical protein T552_00075 [Pneumocystis carinii B80]KTW31431.1 hypothetical protein T552_00075 [Pneumocystis carinii B80]
MWKCLNTSQYISFSRINDDWCDCEDGSDEPGTSACSNGVFFCENLGYISRYIPSSYVNDGICDCCDGSDEYEHNIRCENTCEEQHKKYSQELAKKDYIYKKGSKIRQTWEEKMKHIDKDLEDEIRDISNELKNAIRENQKLKRSKILENFKTFERENVSFPDILNESISNIFEKHKNMFSSFMDLWQEKVGSFDEALTNLKDKYDDDPSNIDLSNMIKSLEEIKSYLDSKNNGYNEYIEELKNDYNKFLEFIQQEYHKFQSKERSFFYSVEEWIKRRINQIKRYFIYLKILIDDEKIDSEIIDNYDASGESNQKIDELREKLEKKELLKKEKYKNFNVYYAVKDEVITFKFKDYIYEFTFLKDAYQISSNDNNRILLGSFSHFDGDNKLYYHNGDRCWNGPLRSVVIELFCGVKNELISVMEYERCVYFMKVLTPGACTLPSNKIKRDEL